MSIKIGFIKFISSGTHPQLEEGKKFAIQIANFDALLTFVTFLFYVFESVSGNHYPLNIIHPLGLIGVTVGFFLIRFRHYDAGRILIHLNGLFQIFITADMYPSHSGYEYYYFISLIIPFVTFSLKEHKKGIFLSAIAAIVLALQYQMGTGLIMKIEEAGTGGRATALMIVIGYILAILGVARWQLDRAQKEIAAHQGELVHTSNLIALGEMASGIAHEINNPLQILSLQSAILTRQTRNENMDTEKINSAVEIISRTISRITKMVDGLRKLSRDDVNDPMEKVTIREITEDVRNISFEKFTKLNIELQVTGDVDHFFTTHPIQLSQVLLNLMNNSIDAIKDEPLPRWIQINAKVKDERITISVVDSGKGITPEVREKMMKPFFTTKAPSLGTGLGLSISTNIVETHGGKLYYDHTSPHTRFVFELPING